MSNVKQILCCQILSEFRIVEVFTAPKIRSDSGPEKVQFITLNDANALCFWHMLCVCCECCVDQVCVVLCCAVLCRAVFFSRHARFHFT